MKYLLVYNTWLHGWYAPAWPGSLIEPHPVIRFRKWAARMTKDEVDLLLHDIGEMAKGCLVVEVNREKRVE